jgi:hypothetical protein
MPCCKKGDVTLPSIREPPPYLKYLLTDDDQLCRSFRTNLRAYNCAFAFTSVSYKKDTRIDYAGGIQCFQIYRQLFYFQGPLRPALYEVPSFAQLFFYDPAYAADVRANNFPHLDRTVLLRLTEMLTDCNPFITVYRTARERLATQQADFRVVLSPQMRLVVEAGADRRRENLPTSDEVTPIIPDEYTAASRRDLILTVAWQKYTYTLCHTGAARNSPCDNAQCVDGQTYNDNESVRMTACPVCTKLAAADAERDEAKRLADEEYARAYAAAFREEIYVGFCDPFLRDLELKTDRYTRYITRSKAERDIGMIKVSLRSVIREGERTGNGPGSAIIRAERSNYNNDNISRLNRQ